MPIWSKNKIFGGLRFDNEKPNMEIFLKPITEEIRKLYNECTAKNFLIQACPLTVAEVAIAS